MELRVLQYFLTVAKEENITKAAEALHITQPTLSRQLALLEEETGVILFHRGSGTRRITLTAEGVLLRRRAEELIELEQKTRMELSANKENYAGTVSVGCGEIAGVGWLARKFQSFRSTYPQTGLKFLTAANPDILEKIEEGLLDFGLLLGSAPSSRYCSFEVKTEERWVLLMRPDNELANKKEVSPQDLKNTELIMPYGNNPDSPINRWLGSVGTAKQAITCNLTANAAVLVTYGLGVAPVIEGAVSFNTEQIVSRPLAPKLITEATLIWKKDQPFSKTAEAFLSHVTRKDL